MRSTGRIPCHLRCRALQEPRMKLAPKMIAQMLWTIFYAVKFVFVQRLCFVQKRSNRFLWWLDLLGGVGPQSAPASDVADTLPMDVFTITAPEEPEASFSPEIPTQSVSHTKWKGQFQVKGQSRWEMNVVKVRKNLKRNQNLDLLRILPRSLRRRRKRRKPNKLRKVMRLGTGKVWGGFTIAVIYIPHYTHLMWSTTSAMFSTFTNVLCFMLAC